MNNPELGGMFLIATPPISRVFQVFSGGFNDVGRGVSEIGATVEEGWFTAAAAEVAGDEPGTPLEAVDAGDSAASASLVDAAAVVPLDSGGLTALGFWIGIAALGCVRAAIALALAR